MRPRRLVPCDLEDVVWSHLPIIYDDKFNVRPTSVGLEEGLEAESAKRQLEMERLCMHLRWNDDGYSSSEVPCTEQIPLNMVVEFLHVMQIAPRDPFE